MGTSSASGRPWIKTGNLCTSESISTAECHCSSNNCVCIHQRCTGFCTLSPAWPVMRDFIVQGSPLSTGSDPPRPWGSPGRLAGHFPICLLGKAPESFGCFGSKAQRASVAGSREQSWFSSGEEPADTDTECPKFPPPASPCKVIGGFHHQAAAQPLPEGIRGCCGVGAGPQ